MSDRDQSLGDIQEYRTARQIAGLFAIFLGLAIHVLTDADSKWRGPQIGVAIILATGCAVTAVALWSRSNHGQPVFTLSPEGILYRVPWVKEVLVPWQEIQGVASQDIVSWIWSPLWLLVNYPTPHRRLAIHRDVTVVRLSKEFYDRHIHVNSLLLRGPGWKATFLPDGSHFLMALHHDLVAVEPQALRDAVEARWHAFRDHPSAMRPATKVVALGANPRSLSNWEAIKIAASVFGIAVMLANFAGLWQLPGQPEGREARAKARAETQYWQDANTRRLEETKQREAEQRKIQRETEETLRRAFGK